ncbi:MAG: 3-phosphoshikimate 1-carboxyvinyltransferase [Pseudomonadota bacterium]
MTVESFRLEPRAFCLGETTVPGDKSISHRAVMLSSLAKGESQVNGFLPSTDCEATLKAFQDLGVQIDRVDANNVRIQGVGLRGLQEPNNALDMGNSGTAMRLMAGILSGQQFSSSLIGDQSLSKRPMQRIQKPLHEMGANIVSERNDTPPLLIQAVNNLSSIQYVLPVPSAQVKSCVLLAGLYAEGKTCVIESTPTRDHTERMLQTFSYPVVIENSSVCIQGGQDLLASSIQVPGDISSAAFFIVAALISKNASLTISNVGVNPTREGVIAILRSMGGNIEIKNKQKFGKEPVADIVVHSSELHAIEFPQSLIANTIDEFPVLFIAAACARGVTKLSGANELRIKESDRIATMASGLKTLGVNVIEKPDGIEIEGGTFQGGEIDSHGDHRVAMAFSVASIRAQAAILIRDVSNVATSFPNFVETAASLGLKVTQH